MSSPSRESGNNGSLVMKTLLWCKNEMVAEPWAPVRNRGQELGRSLTIVSFSLGLIFRVSGLLEQIQVELNSSNDATDALVVGWWFSPCFYPAAPPNGP